MYSLAEFWKELQRRSVCKVGGVYAVVAWLLVEVSSIVLPTFGAPEWVLPSFIFLLGLGFPAALALAWAYEITPEGIRKTDDIPFNQGTTQETARTLDFAIIGLLVVALGVVLIYKYVPGDTGEIASPTSGRVTEPSIAVLPFDNFSGNPDNGPFIAGLVEDLTTRLATWRSFPVIARNSAFDPTLPKNVQEIGKLLNAHYVVEGSVREVGARLRIAVQVIDATTGAHVWAQQYDREFDDVLLLQEEISTAIVASLNPALLEHESERAMYKNPTDVDAWTVAMQGWWHYNKYTREDLEQAHELFQTAIKLDPQWDWPYASVSHVYLTQLFYGWAASPPETVAAALEAAQTAIALDDQDPYAFHAMGHAYALTGEKDKSLAAFSQGIELNPSDAMANNCLGQQLALAGRSAEAIERLKKAMSLSPRDPWIYMYSSGMALAYVAADDYEQAVAWADRSIQQKPDAGAYLIAAASNAHLGRTEQAQRSLEFLRRQWPDLTLPILEAGYKSYGMDPTLIEKITLGLRKAGLEG